MASDALKAQANGESTRGRAIPLARKEISFAQVPLENKPLPFVNRLLWTPPVLIKSKLSGMTRVKSAWFVQLQLNLACKRTPVMSFTL